MYKVAEPTTGFSGNMAYPQYASMYDQQDIISTNTWHRLQLYVLESLNDKAKVMPTVTVREHMIRILDGIIPFGMRIVGTK